MSSCELVQVVDYFRSTQEAVKTDFYQAHLDIDIDLVLDLDSLRRKPLTHIVLQDLLHKHVDTLALVRRQDKPGS